MLPAMSFVSFPHPRRQAGCPFHRPMQRRSLLASRCCYLGAAKRDNRNELIKNDKMTRIRHPALGSCSIVKQTDRVSTHVGQCHHKQVLDRLR